MRSNRLAVAGLLAALGIGLAAQGGAGNQDAPGAATLWETPTSVARLLADRKAFAELTAKGKVKRTIKMADPTYAMIDGPTRAVLLKLPDYQKPYALTIKSFQYKHAFSFTYGIFVPVIAVLDGDFAVTRTVPETALQWKSMSMMKGPRLEASLQFAEPEKGERFVLLYTRGNSLGRPVPKPDPSSLLNAETTAEGNIEAETHEPTS